MNFKDKIWNLILDPILKKVESRLRHYESLRPGTHDGGRWSDVGVIGRSVLFFSESLLTNSGKMNQLRIGDFCYVRGEVVVQGDGEFEIGHHSFIGPGTRIWCSRQVKIGSHVLISHLVDIHDSNSHSMDWRLRQAEGLSLFEAGVPAQTHDVTMEPVVIEDHVWIGFKSSILKGVTIGRGAVVAACSVVTRDVAPHTLVAGNPAEFVRELPR